MARMSDMVKVDRSKLQAVDTQSMSTLEIGSRHVPPSSILPGRSPFFHCSLPQRTTNLDQLNRQFYIGGAVPQQRIFTR